MRTGIAALVAAVAIALHASGAAAFEKTYAPLESPLGDVSYGLSTDCTLRAYNTCSCWTWVYSPGPGDEWGTVFDPDECPGGCAGGGSLTEIWFYSNCVTPPAPPRTIGGVSVHSVDAVGCWTGLLWSSGPMTVTHCTGSDHWTHINVPAGAATFSGNPFCVSIRMGGIVSGGSPRLELLSDDGIANLYCSRGTTGHPGCQSGGCTCAGWAGALPAQRSYIYFQDITGDHVPDDLCAAYGAPVSLAFPFVAPYGYLPNNLLIRAGLSCSLPTSVENPLVKPDSWGHVKSLYH